MGTRGGAADSGGKGQKHRVAPARVAVFRHVRFNRVHVAITYKGTYFSLKDAQVVHCGRLSFSVSLTRYYTERNTMWSGSFVHVGRQQLWCMG